MNRPGRGNSGGPVYRFYNKCWGQAMSLAPKLQSKVEHRDKILYHKSTTNHNKGEISMLNKIVPEIPLRHDLQLFVFCLYPNY